MWILKNSTDRLDNLKSRSFSQVSSIKTFDFSTLYTTLQNDKLKTRLKETIHKASSHRNYGSKFVVLGYNSTYFSNKIQKGKTCYSEEQVISITCDICHYASKQFHNISVVPLLLQTKSLSGE
jgi:aspartate/glutamate racemase